MSLSQMPQASFKPITSVPTRTLEDVLAREGLCVSTNVGTSMLPLLREGRDVVAIQALSAQSSSPTQAKKTRAQRYDAVLYKHNNRYVLHRVLNVDETGYTICGDHCVRREKRIPEGELLGILFYVHRDGKLVPVDMHWKEHGNPKPPLVYRTYVHLWCDLYPARAALLTVRRLGSGALHRIKRKKRS